MVVCLASAVAGRRNDLLRQGMRVSARVSLPTMDAEPRPDGLTLESLFRAHVGDVYRMVARLLGPQAPVADTEDLVQEVFVAANRGFASFRGDAKPTTWLYGIASRVVLMHLRSSWRRRRLWDAFGTHVVDAVRTTERDVGARDTLRQVWSCLNRLSPQKRVIYLLCDVEGLSGAEAAAALDIPINTVWTRLHHARMDLWRELEAAGVEVTS